MFYTENILQNFWIRNGRNKNIYAALLLLFAVILAGVTAFLIIFMTQTPLLKSLLILFIASATLTFAAAALFTVLGVATLRSVKIPARIMGKQIREKIYPVTVYLDMENVPIPIERVLAFSAELKKEIKEQAAFYAYGDFTDERLMESSRELWRNGFRIVHTPHRLSLQSAENFMNVSDLEIGYHALIRAMQRKIKHQKVIIISSDRGFIALAMRLLDLDVQVAIWAPALSPAYTAMLKVIGAEFRFFAHWRSYSSLFYVRDYSKETANNKHKKPGKFAETTNHSAQNLSHKRITIINESTDSDLAAAAALYPDKAARLTNVIASTLEYIQSYGSNAPKAAVLDKFGIKRAENLHEFLTTKHIVHYWLLPLTALDCIRLENDTYSLGSTSAQVTAQLICFYVKEIGLSVETYFKLKPHEKKIKATDFIKHLMVYSSDILKYRIGFLMSSVNYQSTIHILIQIAGKMGVLTAQTDSEKTLFIISAPITVTSGVTVDTTEISHNTADLKDAE